MEDKEKLIDPFPILEICAIIGATHVAVQTIDIIRRAIIHEAQIEAEKKPPESSYFGFEALRRQLERLEQRLNILDESQSYIRNATVGGGAAPGNSEGSILLGEEEFKTFKRYALDSSKAQHEINKLCYETEENIDPGSLLVGSMPPIRNKFPELEEVVVAPFREEPIDGRPSGSRPWQAVGDYVADARNQIVKTQAEIDDAEEGLLLDRVQQYREQSRPQ